LGLEGNASDGSPSKHLPYHSEPSPAFYRVQFVNYFNPFFEKGKIDGIHAPDSDHIAFAVLNLILYPEKTIFVTLDFKTIVSKRDLVKVNHKIECCDPLYTIHHI
jgi:hypothetical protein